MSELPPTPPKPSTRHFMGLRNKGAKPNPGMPNPLIGKINTSMSIFPSAPNLSLQKNSPLPDIYTTCPELRTFKHVVSLDSQLERPTASGVAPLSPTGGSSPSSSQSYSFRFDPFVNIISPYVLQQFFRTAF